MEIVKSLNQLSVVASMLQQVAAGQVSFNQGSQPVDDREAIELLSRLVVEQVEATLRVVADG